MACFSVREVVNFISRKSSKSRCRCVELDQGGLGGVNWAVSYNGFAKGRTAVLPLS